jgi:uncharacterized protein (DUF58 family)
MTEVVDAPIESPTHEATDAEQASPAIAARRAPGVWSVVGSWMHSVLNRLRPITSSVTPTGWTVLVLSAVAWIAGTRLGWVELRTIAFAGVVLFVLCALLGLGRTKVEVSIELDPQRVVAGEPAAGRVVVTNVGKVRLLPLMLEIPIGASSARFDLPSLATGATHEEVFIVQTVRRGVIPIGPALTVRGDPLGLIRRSIAWTEVHDLYAHPVTVPLGTIGSGLIRDLEGQTATNLSTSDLAFHALREYVPGDDRRHIHWKSSAKIGASIPGGKFMVKQYLDTRRSHLTVVVDGRETAYATPDDFETAASAAASIAVRAIRDGIDTSVVVADQSADGVAGQLMLDRFSLAQFGRGGSLSDLAALGARSAPDTSIAVLVTGANSDFGELRRAAVHFPPEVNTIGLRIDPARPTGVADSPALVLLDLPHLGDLAALLRGGGIQ